MTEPVFKPVLHDTHAHICKAWTLNHQDPWFQNWKERQGRTQHRSCSSDQSSLYPRDSRVNAKKHSLQKKELKPRWLLDEIYGDTDNTVGYRWAQQFLFRWGLWKWHGGSNAISSLFALTMSSPPRPQGAAQSRKRRAGFPRQPSQDSEEQVRDSPRGSQKW